MNPTVENFRATFPRFTAQLYPCHAVEFRLRLADRFFSESIWGEDKPFAMYLYTAHYLLAYGSPEAGGSGSGGGMGMGVVASKSVDGVSVSYDTSSSAELGAGFWNSTPYGRELWIMMRGVGGGVLQL